MIEKHVQGDHKKFSAMCRQSVPRIQSRGHEEQLVDNKEALKNKKTKLMNTDKQLAICKYEEARAGEIDAMGKAKDISSTAPTIPSEGCASLCQIDFLDQNRS